MRSACRIAIATLALSCSAAWAQDPRFKPWPRDPGRPDVQRVGLPPLRVTDIATAGDTIWVATRGAGAFRIDAAGITHLDLGRPLPSALVWQVQPWREKVLIGTAEGAVSIETPGSPSPRLDRPPLPGAAPAPRLSADVIRISPRDDMPLVQLRAAGDAGGQAAAVTQWRANAQGLVPDSGLPPRAVITASSIDARSGCLDLAGVTIDNDGPALWFASECKAAAQSRRVVVYGKPVPDAIAVAALARDPATGRPVLAIVRQRGQDPATRRHALFDLTEQGTLLAHCSPAETREEITAMVADPTHAGLIVARHGAGVVAVDCEGARPLLAEPGPLLWATALALDEHGAARLLVGTDSGLFALMPVPGSPAAPWTLQTLLATRSTTLPADALPSDISADDQRILATAPGSGAFEIERHDSGWQIVRQWRAGAPLPAGVYGPAVYTTGGDAALLVHSQGIFELQGSAGRWLNGAAVESRPHLLGVAAVPGRGIWVAQGATPAAAGAGLRWYPQGAPAARPVLLPGALTEPGGSLLAWPDGSVWAASRAGLLRADTDGNVRLLSTSRVQSIFRQRHDPKQLAVVGASIERWAGERFEPVLFSIPSEVMKLLGPLGHPIDVAIDTQGRWAILYSSGRLVLLDAERQFEKLLGGDDGIAPSARKLLLRRTAPGDELLLGSGGEGIFVYTRR